MSDHDFDEPKQPAHGYHTQAAANLTQADIERKNKLFSNLIDGIGTRDRDVLCESVMLYSPDGKTELIKEARVQFVYGRKYGLVGRNGIGKSTLLRAVSNYALQGFPQHLRVVYVEQEEIEGDQRPCLQFVIESDEENNWLHSEQERLYNELENGDDSDDTFDADVIQQRLDKIDERLDEIDSRRIDMRAQSILTGLGFTNEMQHKPVTELSGGWRRRVAMACALLVYPDIMLLDEPTNHLDFAAVAWLQAYLKTVPCTLVIVSHDRDFINTICTDVIWLHHKKLDYFRGDYESFVKVKEEQNKTQQHQYEVQQKKIADTKEFINEAKTSGNPDLQRLAVTKQKMLDKLLKEELIEAPDSDKEFRFTFPKPGKLDHALLECHDMDFAYNVDPDTVTDDTPMLLHNINVNLTMESRVALLGHNGAGKTTLIKVIMGKYKPVRGVCRFNEHARAAFFTQHHVDQLNLEMSALEYLQSVHTDAKEYQIRCLSPSTRVLKHDGTSVAVQDLSVGDLLCGDHGNYVTVTVVGKPQNGVMYKVQQNRGQTYYCNDNHILVLKATGVAPSIGVLGYYSATTHPDTRVVSWYSRCAQLGCGCGGFHGKTHRVGNTVAGEQYKTELLDGQHDVNLVREGDEFEITVKQWLKCKKDTQARLKGYKAARPITLHQTSLPIPPYLLGLWLGDGDADRPYFTVVATQTDVIQYIEQYALQNQLVVSVDDNTSELSGQMCYRLRLKSLLGYKTNTFTLALQQLNLLNNKHIPTLYLNASESDRLELLAGLIDTDGNLHASNGGQSFRFAQSENHIRVLNDTVHLAQTLGITTSSVGTYMNYSNRWGKQTFKDGSTFHVMHEVYMKGSKILQVPLKVAYKRPSSQHTYYSAASKLTITQVPASECDQFISLAVSDNQRFLLEDLTVTHNSIMGRFGFDSQLISQKIATLSGGQKSRVAMALLTWKEPHLIIMDEPTNHLDIETIEALINAIKLFQGAVVVISHDTHFIGQVATEYWALNEQGDLHTFFELDDAKIFAYKPIQFNPDDISLKRLVAQKQAEKIESNAANKQESQKTFVRNKNKSKKGKGGIDILADEKQRIAEEQANTAAAQQALQARQELSDDDIEQSNIEQSVKQASKTINKKANNKQNVTASFSLLSLDIEQGMDSDEERQQRKIKKKQAALLAEAANIDAEAEAERKRIKKEKKRLKALLGADDDNENVIDPNDLPDAEEEVVEKPKKKKSSKKVDFDAVAETSDIEIELEKPKKKKKSKQTDNDNDDNDDVPMKKSSKSKSSRSGDNDTDEPVKQKSSKKSTGVDSDDDSTHSEQKEIVKKKKKKKNVDSDDDTPAPAKQSNTRDSDDEIDTNKKKKKSSKSKSKPTNDSDNEESAKPKKSKSKSKQADSDEEVVEKPKKSKSKSKSKATVDDDGD